MKIEAEFKKQLYYIGLHEAGHYIVATHLGFQCEDISATVYNLNKDHIASTITILDKSLPNHNSVIDYCEKRVQMLYAGSLAQSLVDNKINLDRLKAAFKSEGVSDLEKVVELVTIVRGCKYPDIIGAENIIAYSKQIDQELLNKSAKIVLDNQTLIFEIGQLLIEGLNTFGEKFILKKAKIQSLPKFREKFIL